MQFGMSTLVELSDIEACTALAQSLSLRFVELNMNLPQYQPHRIDRNELHRCAKAYDVEYTIHIDEAFNPFDFNPRVTNAYLQTLSDTIALAKEIGARTLVMHMPNGVHFKLPTEKRYLFNVFIDEYLDRVQTFRDTAENLIGDAEITICIENTTGFSVHYMQEALSILLKSNVFALTYDVGHDHVIGQADLPFYLNHTSKLAHMHLHDASDAKNHLPLGTANVDIARFLDIAKDADCRTVVEVKTVDGLRQSVQWLKQAKLF